MKALCVISAVLLVACGPSARELETARLQQAVDDASKAAREARQWADAVHAAEKRFEPDYRRQVKEIELEFDGWPRRGAAEADRRERKLKEAYEKWQARADASAKAALGK